MPLPARFAGWIVNCPPHLPGRAFMGELEMVEIEPIGPHPVGIPAYLVTPPDEIELPDGAGWLRLIPADDRPPVPADFPAMPDGVWPYRWSET